jgi:hypothetical protein
MHLFTRREAMRCFLGGTVIPGAGVALISNAAEAVPLAVAKTLPDATDKLVQEAQAIVVSPRRRRVRRRVCWWRRGRRVCAWR